MYSTTVTRHIAASPAKVYRALLDAGAVQAWRVPDGMTSEVHVFEPREGGAYRISLTYDDHAATGKSAGRTDTYHGRFVELVPDRLVREVTEFETDNPDLQGEMHMTTTLTQIGTGTDVTIAHDGIPDIVPPADNELGTRMSLDKLAALVEAR